MTAIEPMPIGASLITQLIAVADKHPNRRFCRLNFCGKRHEINYRSLFDGGLKYAALLRRNGVAKEDVVLIFLPSHPEMYAAFVGAMFLGAIPSYMPGPSAKQDVSYFWESHRALIERIKPRAMIAAGAALHADIHQHLEPGGELPVLLARDAHDAISAEEIVLPQGTDTAFLQHSSGTTGLKKGVAISHEALRCQINAYSRAIALSNEDVIATWLPLYHDMGLVTSTLMPMMTGITVLALDPFEWAADPRLLLDLMSKDGATLTWMPNFAFEHLVRSVPFGDDRLDLGHVRAFINCSERCFPETFERFQAHFAIAGVRKAQLQTCYAMAETVFAVSQTPIGQEARTTSFDAARLRDQARATCAECGSTIQLLSNGPLIEGVGAGVVGQDGRELNEGEIGEIVVSGDCVFSGYLGQPDVTRQRLRDGRYHTRDRGFILGGELYLLGRTDDLLIVHGKNFHASEIEAAASRVAGIKPGRVAATGRENAETGTTDVVIVAETAIGGDAALNALKRAVKNAIFEELALTVRSVAFVAPGQLKKTTSGKVSREPAISVNTATAPLP